ncbi:hypothetical protein BDR06DRAFT_1061605 [Suillus hirtellus]|nr:hypothetical protein BDR06DRAFT_1061605 [Suillus hirtellus]
MSSTIFPDPGTALFSENVQGLDLTITLVSDNLRNDTKYITSWTSAGWSTSTPTRTTNHSYLLANDAVTHVSQRFASNVVPVPHKTSCNLIYLPLITERIHIIPKFVSNHIDLGAPPFVFREVFNIFVDVNPAWVKLTSPSAHHNHASFWSLASLGFPETHSKSLELSLANCSSPQHQRSSYMEWESDYSPASRFGGQHMRWTASMEKIADVHARCVMNAPPTPPYISMHIRHEDFSQQCEEFSVDPCFAPLSVITRRVSEVQEELRTRKGIDAMHVIMRSDERDPEWWSDVRVLGWAWVDYTAERIKEISGKWHLLNGAGFVGTHGSSVHTG